jgi:hypothetical protein
MPSGATDKPPRWSTANANAEQMDVNDKLLPLPAAANAKEKDDDDTAGVAVEACQGAEVSRQMWMTSHHHCYSLAPMYITSLAAANAKEAQDDDNAAGMAVDVC